MKCNLYNVIIFILLLNSGCDFFKPKNSTDINLYLVNNSFTIPKIELVVYIDNQKIIEDTFVVSDIVPNDKLYSQSLSKGKHLIRVEYPAEKVFKEKSIEVGDSILNVFISFNYHIPTANEIKAHKELHDLIYGGKKKFNSDSLILPKKIIIHTIQGKVVLR